MAWNEPGGGKDKDPWGNRGGDQGPPDLDEAFRKLKGQLSGMFGGGSGGGAGGGRGFNYGFFGLVVGLAVIGYLFWGLYQVDQQERGVVFRFGAVKPDVVMPGLHWNPPIIDQVEMVNVTRVRSHAHQALMLTEDENIVDVSMTVQYVIQDPIDHVTQVRNPEGTLQSATESALRHVVGSSLIDEVITEGRAAIAAQVQERLQTYLSMYRTGYLVSTVNIDHSGPPEQVQAAFDDVQRAQEDENRYVNEANAYAERVIPEARGEAQRQIEQATAYRERVIAQAQGEAARFSKLLAEFTQAEEVTRDRLYLDAMQQVLSQSSKILVDLEGGNNLLYLPLDRIVQESGRSAGGMSEADMRHIADMVVNDIDTSARTTSGRQGR